jgi:uncharacterized membrane protein YjjP (DUF1212 family)
MDTRRLPTEEPNEHSSASACRVADLLLDMGTVLQGAGAHCGRIKRNIERVAATWGYSMDLFITFTGIMVSLQSNQDPSDRVARFRSSPSHGVHFGVLTDISLLTWRIAEENLDMKAAEQQWAEIRTPRHNPRWLILLGIGSACASLCILAGGDWRNACLGFVAAVSGMFVRQEALKLRFNPMIAFIAAAFVTSLIAGMDMIHHIGRSPEKTLATSVLYLIPGVPLINCAIDLIEGHINTAVARAIHGGFILLSIAVGMSLSIILLGLGNF